MTLTSLNRRTFVGSGALALALYGLASERGNAAITVDAVDGIAGGGSMQAGSGPAEFSVFAARFTSATPADTLVAGSLSYLDVVGKTTIESISISAIAPVEGSVTTTRQLSGTATVDGKGVHPFDAVLTDGGPIGSGSDRFELRVGADGETTVGNQPMYEVQSVVQAGNLQLIAISGTAVAEGSPTPAG